MAATAVIADPDHIYGMGRLTPDAESAPGNVFAIEFLDHYHWELLHSTKVLLRSRFGFRPSPSRLSARMLSSATSLASFRKPAPRSGSTCGKCSTPS